MEDELVSRISRRSIDILKQNYRASPIFLPCFHLCRVYGSSAKLLILFINAGGPVYGRLETCCEVENNIEDTMSSQVFLFNRQLSPQKPGLTTAWKESTG